MTTEEYMAVTMPAVDFLVDKFPFASVVAQAEQKTHELISMLEEIATEAQQHIKDLKSLEG